MLDINEILRAQACDNLPREVSHDTQLANRAPDQPEGRREALPVDSADAGGDQADAGDVIGICADPFCGKPVTRETGHVHSIRGLEPYACHHSCIPF